MDPTARRRGGNSGVVLLAALGFLFVFSMLGVAYVGYMTTEYERTRFETRAVHARYAARGGVEAAIARLQSALASGTVAEVLSSPGECEFPLYKFDRTAKEGLAQDTNRRCVTQIKITDESGKVNLNCAPTRMLQAVLHVDGDTARRIRSALPQQQDAAVPPAAPALSQAWLASLDDLATRGLVPQSIYNAIPKELVTVHSVVDPGQPQAFLNVNAAAPEVLAAILDVPLDVANQVASKRPFNTLDELCAAAGKDPSAFNVKSAPGELTLQSRCFRIESEANLLALKADGSGEYSVRHSRTEAVVVFDEAGAPQITFWNETAERAENDKA